ncbi:MAG: hypothetical protein V4580_06575 [Bacteroidota bacterium]
MTYKLYIVVLFIGMTSFACSQPKADKPLLVTTLTFDYLEGCETGKGDCKPIEIVRHSKQDSVLLIFPGGGTLSDVYLRSPDKKIELHDTKRALEGKPRLNLTGLNDGSYTAHMISCALGGACTIILKTE